MSIPEPKVIEEMTKKLISDAARDGTLSKLSPKIVRERLEEQFELDDRALKPYKGVIAKAIDDWKEAKTKQEEIENGASDEEDENPPQKKKAQQSSTKPSKKPQASSSLEKSNTKTKKRKSEPNEEEEEAEISSSKKRPRLPARTKSKDKKAFTSLAVVPPSSDLEDEITTKQPTEESVDETTPRKSSSTKSSSPAKSKQPSKPTSSNSLTISKESKSRRPAEEDEKSESELSVLIDEAPKPKKKGKAKESTAPKEVKEKKKGGTSNPTKLSKDEETIKKLKSLILACGVRKVWSKLFKDIPEDHSQQIKLLRKMLTDLGMTGRLSMEQAKAIREKRELASELADVQSFERSVKEQGTRRSRSAATKEESDSGSQEGSEEEEEEEAAPTKRKKNARLSIMAFLEDQSDSE
ncbi:hypothetical protein BDP27DRAFT_314167 [Rhodocollybia butyracea]|uniref:DEK C-terminal domain-containing protein n=1 Tax=Rhodocollybia butyracea TaxID=206335 RepID=A0A9P5PVE2_9AGAR|nr:hypothetical protein BDP27DRAFT_314167 [Rhodocollybia butyracea]